MKINKVTITGLDTIGELDKVVELQKRFSFCEWGILFSSKKEGTPRYPSKEVIEKIIETGILLSAHFCGSYSRGILENQEFGLIDKLHPNFKRVQLNYNFGHNQNWSMTHLNLYAKDSERNIILQYNKSNKEIIDSFIEHFPKDINLLYDASGGRGTEIKEVLPPFENYTGYSGGINDKNVGDICSAISTFDNSSEVWIDMESGVRTDNVLDLEKVESVLKKVLLHSVK